MTCILAQPEGDTFTFDEDSHTYWLNGLRLPSVTQVIDSLGLVSGKQFYGPEDAQRGQAVHAITQLIDENDLDESSIDPALAGYAASYDRFRRETDWLPYLNECRLFSRQWKFAGTIDRYGVLNGKTVLLDIKSGPYHRWHDIQLGGYEIMLLENKKDLGVEPPESRLILQLKRDGTYRIHQTKTNPSDARSLFIAALSLMRFKEL
jgi:hypothetical protein